MTGSRISRRAAMLSGAAALAVPFAPARAKPAYDIAPHEVAAGVWMIEGAPESFTRENGGAMVNVTLVETRDGAIVIDTGSTATMGAVIRAFADERLGGVALAINTHHHPDHWFGNMAFADRPVAALPATISASAVNAQAYSESLYAILGSWMSGTVTTPATQELAGGVLEIGERSLSLLPLVGHTAADLALIDAQTGTLIAGDLLFLDRAPSLPDAEVSGWLGAIDTLATLDVSGTIPGHGRYHRSSAALFQTKTYLQTLHARLTLAAELGLSPMEAMEAGPVPEFARLGANPDEYRRTVAQRWRDFEIEALPVIGGT
ncbi:MAG: quinoprotein relay system zinc metallohydrolase 1 [Pseudomonadota bacterium]